MIYRLLLDQALTVRSTPVLSFAVCFSRRIDDCSGFAGSSVGCDIKSSLACLLTDKSSFVY